MRPIGVIAAIMDSPHIHVHTHSSGADIGIAIVDDMYGRFEVHGIAV